jgi:hypothetical protein
MSEENNLVTNETPIHEGTFKVSYKVYNILQRARLVVLSPEGPVSPYEENLIKRFNTHLQANYKRLLKAENEEQLREEEKAYREKQAKNRAYRKTLKFSFTKPEVTSPEKS